MGPETRECQNCKTRFTIEPEDFQFYEKVSVPPPTFCPQCRTQRRMSWRNERSLSRRTCGLCNKSIVTLYSSEKPFPVYCADCFWSDKWDPSTYGREFDFSRPFFEQFAELRDQVPRLALLSKNSQNSEYTNHASGNKNCYLSTVIFNSEDVLYSRKSFTSRNMVDSEFIFDNGELLYQCVWGEQLYKCIFSIFCSNGNNLSFCYDCKGCSDCFMSSNLRNQQFVFRNQKLKESDYRARMAEFDFGSAKTIAALTQEFARMKESSVQPALRNEQCTEVVGDYLLNCAHVHECYLSSKGERNRYCIEFDPAGGRFSVDCMDCFGFGSSELLYEVQAQASGYQNRFCSWSYEVSHSDYLDMCFNVQSCFGCVGLHSKEEFFILNRRYSQKEYEDLKQKIITHMQETKEWGEFFPTIFSPFAYNETVAQEYFPLSQQEALANGYRWHESEEKHVSPTLKGEQLPDSIRETPETIVNEVIACAHQGKCNAQCLTVFKITSQELAFYKNMGLPLPRLCFHCRREERVALYRNPLKLWHRTCMCDYKVHSNSAKHAHHTSGRCPNEFQTTYAPERKEIVYCEQCYAQEVA